MTTNFTSFVEDLKLGDELAPDRIAEQDAELLRLSALVLAMTTDPDDIQRLLETIYKAGIREGQIAMQRSTLEFVQRLAQTDEEDVAEFESYTEERGDS